MKKLTKIFCALFVMIMLVSVSSCSKNPYKGMKPEEILYTVGTWERQYSPSISMSFNKDGTGTQTNNGFDYEYYWNLDDDELDVEVIGFWTVEYEFSMKDITFIITNKENNTTATFIPKGSQASTLPDNGTNPSELEGTWNCQGSYSYVFNSDKTAYTYDPNDPSKTHVTDLKWTYVKSDDILYTYNADSDFLRYLRYKINGKEMTLTFLSSSKDYKYTKE